MESGGSIIVNPMLMGLPEDPNFPRCGISRENRGNEKYRGKQHFEQK